MDKLYLNAGQMKAGTTYLFHLLREHPKLFRTIDKEIHFLAHYFGVENMLGFEARKARALRAINTQLPQHKDPMQSQRLMRWAKNYLSDTNSFDWYYKAFQDKPHGHWAVDFSNLTCDIPPESLRKIHRHVDLVKVTYCYRDPMARAFSHIKFHLKFSGDGRKVSELSRSDLRSLIRSKAILPQVDTETHLRNLTRSFSEENIRIVIAEDMWQQPQRVVNGVTKLLGIHTLKVEKDLGAVNEGPPADLTQEMADVIRSELSEQFRAAERSIQAFSHLVI